MDNFNSSHTCRSCGQTKGFFQMVLVRGKAQPSCKECKNQKSRDWAEKNLVTARKSGAQYHPWGGRTKKRGANGMV